MNNSTTASGPVYAPPWVPEPNTRGTWDIVYSCAFTLSLCVWSAIHLNVPGPNEKFPDRAQSWRKAKWVFISIFAPEVTLYAAWYQYYTARRFCWTIDNIRRQESGREEIPIHSWWQKTSAWSRRILGMDSLMQRDSQEQAPGSKEGVKLNESPNARAPSKIGKPNDSDDNWKPASLTYGFYVVMGGLKVDVSDIYDNLDWMVLSPSGVIEMAKISSSKYFWVDDKNIKDQSKADNLAKALVVLQVLWSLTQCSSRLASGHAVSVLEIHTLVHAFCALLMYGLWFRKPLNIGEPTKVDSTAFRNELAFNMVRSSVSRGSSGYQFPKNCVFNPTLEDPRFLARRKLIPGTDSRVPEANFLIFDTTCLDSSLRPGQEGPTQEVSSKLQVLQDSNERNAQHELHFADRADVNASPLGNIESQSRTRSRTSQNAARLLLSDPPSFYRAPSDKAIEIQTLTTGEILSCGIGPRAILSCGNGGAVVSWKEFKLRFRDEMLKKLSYHVAPIRRWREWEKNQIVDISHMHVAEELQCLMPEYWERGTGDVYHPLTISLSHRDVVRWERAAIVYKARLRAKIAALAQEKDGSPLSVPRSASLDQTSRPKPRTEQDSIDELYVATKKIRRLIGLNLQYQDYGSLFPNVDCCDERALNLPVDAIPDPLQLLDPEKIPTLSEVSHSVDFPRLIGEMIIPLIVAALISAAYAGIHLALWKHVFPTKTETILWKLSGCTIGIPVALCVVCPIIVSLFSLVVLVCKKIIVLIWGVERLAAMIERLAAMMEWLEKVAGMYEKPGIIAVLLLPLACGWILAILLSLVLHWGLLAYVFARFYIVIESFASIRLVEVGVYNEISWANYMPHF